MATASMVASAGLPGREGGFRAEVNLGARVSMGGRELAIVSSLSVLGVTTTFAILAVTAARRAGAARHRDEDSETARATEG